MAQQGRVAARTPVDEAALAALATADLIRHVPFKVATHGWRT